MNRQWEEGWKQTRILPHLYYNAHVKEADQLPLTRFMPLPSDPRPAPKDEATQHASFFAALAGFSANANPN